MSEGQWYYCLKHHAVEPYDGCKNVDRLGPYETRDEAARALETVRERNEEWERDARWDDDQPARAGGDDPGLDLNPFNG